MLAGQEGGAALKFFEVHLADSIERLVQVLERIWQRWKRR